MPNRIAALLFSLWLAGSLAAQGIAAYFPEASAPRAAKLLAAIDQASAAIEARRNGAWRAELAAEASAVEAYALIAASRSGRGPWASPDGSAKASGSPSALSGARARAKAAALSLAAGDGENAASRDAAAEALARLILASGMGGKSAAALERSLVARSRDYRLFPELAEIGELLRQAGGAGAREAAAATSRRSAEGIALSLIASKARVAALATGAEAPLARLEAVSRAYRAWIAAFALAAYPGDLSSDSDVDKAVVAAGVSAFAALKPDRAEALVEAMALGDGRDAAAAQAARRLAEAWQRSPEPRRRDLAATCGIPESTMALFCSSLALRAKPRAAAPQADPVTLASALNGLAAAIAEEEASPSAERGPDLSLLLLERPELAAVARTEARYANLNAEASRRIGAIYAQAAADASSRMESMPSLARAAARALGAAPAGLGVRAVDLGPPPGEAGRRLAFVATATDASGSSLSLPLGAAAAGEAYALAFAKASGLEASRVNPTALLAKYGQYLVSAYDPEGSGDSLAIDAFPLGGGLARLGPTELELALLGGWLP
jgi:hypothetical protein